MELFDIGLRVSTCTWRCWKYARSRFDEKYEKPFCSYVGTHKRIRKQSRQLGKEEMATERWTMEKKKKK